MNRRFQKSYGILFTVELNVKYVELLQTSFMTLFTPWPLQMNLIDNVHSMLESHFLSNKYTAPLYDLTHT